jgi:hypothetical protein
LDLKGSNQALAINKQAAWAFGDHTSTYAPGCMLQTSTHTSSSHKPLDGTDISIHQHPKSYVFPASTEWQNVHADGCKAEE